MNEDCLACEISLCVLVNVFLGPQGPLLIEVSLPSPTPCPSPGLTTLTGRVAVTVGCVVWPFIRNFYWFHVQHTLIAGHHDYWQL